MTKILATSDGVTTEIDLKDESPIKCIVHSQGIKVDVPDFVEINPRTTLSCMEKMKQNEWDWISGGGVFPILFEEALQDHKVKIPKTIEELNNSDFGVIHLSGMIILACEAFFSSKSIFVRNPETYLHPAVERRLMIMFKKMMDICGVTGEVSKKTTKTPPEQFCLDNSTLYRI